MPVMTTRFLGSVSRATAARTATHLDLAACNARATGSIRSRLSPLRGAGAPRSVGSPGCPALRPPQLCVAASGDYP